MPSRRESVRPKTILTWRPSPSGTAVPARPSFLDRLASTSHAWVAAASVVLVVLMIVPVPPWVLDMLLSVNITVALVILLTALYTENALAFSVFPTLLLIVTLFRLSLNITGTRSILLHGYAGQVIEAFGNVVVGGNYAVGIVIFAILIVIQFVVITNGAGRVAEVAARFTLDAMPGKQLAVDADLNAGLITEAEARQRRKDIQRAADFYGAMDGASKFVRGDADRGRHHRRSSTSSAASSIGVAAAGHVDPRSAAAVHAADDRRRHRHADPRAADLDRDRHHRHARGLRRLVRARPVAPARPRAARAADRRRLAGPVRVLRAAAAVHVRHGGDVLALWLRGRALRRQARQDAVPARRAIAGAPGVGGSSPRRRSSRPNPWCRCSRTIRWSWRSASA